MSKIEKIKTQRVKKEAFTEMEVERIRNVTSTGREKAIVEFLLSTGCRVAELVGIRLDEIEGDRVLIHGKGQKDRYVYMNAKTQLAVENYLVERKDANPYLFAGGWSTAVKHMHGAKKNWYKTEEYVTPDEHLDIGSVQHILRRLAKLAGVKQANPHKFRRTCATFALRRGMPIEQVSKMLGHEQISTTQIYLDLNEEDLAHAHKKYVT